MSLSTNDEFNFRVETFSTDLEGIKQFTVFVDKNLYKLLEKSLICEDVKICSGFLNPFL